MMAQVATRPEGASAGQIRCRIYIESILHRGNWNLTPITHFRLMAMDLQRG